MNWGSGAEAVVSIDGSKATLKGSGSVTLTATIGSLVRTVAITSVKNADPTFVKTDDNSLTIKAVASVTDLTPYLHVSDTDAGQTLTWSQTANGAPGHGTLTIGTDGTVTETVPSTGNTDITPGGTITYTPKDNATDCADGVTDSFTIQVSDGQSGTAGTKAFTITMDGAAPTVTISAATVKGGTDVTVQSSEKGTVYLVSSSLTAEAVDTVDELDAFTGATNVMIETADTNTNIAAPSAEGTYAAVAVDAAGNVSAKSTKLITVDNTAPTIESATVSSDYKYVDITFSEGVYSADDGSGAIDSSDLDLAFDANEGSATGVTVSSVKQNDKTDEASAGDLEGGETTVRVFITVTGTPSGKETIEIKPKNDASVYDPAGNAMADTASTGELKLYTPVSSGGGNSGGTPADSAPRIRDRYRQRIRKARHGCRPVGH